MNGSVRMICSYSRSTDLISINDVNHENKQTGVWLLHKHYPFVPTVIQNVSLNLPLFLESRYSRKCVLMPIYFLV